MNARATTPSQLSTLRSRLRGRLITPETADYDQARTLFMGGFDRRPAAIIRPADSADVARAILFARDGECALAIRSGGHSGSGHSSVDGGIVIDLRFHCECAVKAPVAPVPRELDAHVRPDSEVLRSGRAR